MHPTRREKRDRSVMTLNVHAERSTVIDNTAMYVQNLVYVRTCMVHAILGIYMQYLQYLVHTIHGTL